MPFIGTFLFLLFFCGGLFFVMYRVLGAQAMKTTQQLMAISDEQAKKNEGIQKSLKEGELKAARIMNEAKQEAERLKKDAREQAELASARVENEARAEAERIVDEAVKGRDVMKKELVDQMEARVSERACQFVLEVLPLEVRKSTHDHMLLELMNEGLKALEKMDSKEKSFEVAIVSAFPLSDEQRGQIVQSVRRKINREPVVTEQVDESLVAGLRIRLGHLILEGSLAHRLREAAKSVH